MDRAKKADWERVTMTVSSEVAGVVVVVGNNGVVDLARVPPLQVLLHDLIEEADGAAGCGNGVLRIHGQDNEPIHFVIKKLVYCLLGEGIPIAHSNVDLAFDSSVTKFGYQTVCLLLRQLTNGRSTADRLVIGAGIWSPSSRNSTCNERLERLDHVRQSDDVRIIEEVEQKVFNFTKLLWSPQVQKQNSYFVIRPYRPHSTSIV